MEEEEDANESPALLLLYSAAARRVPTASRRHPPKCQERCCVFSQRAAKGQREDHGAAQLPQRETLQQQAAHAGNTGKNKRINQGEMPVVLGSVGKFHALLSLSFFFVAFPVFAGS